MRKILFVTVAAMLYISNAPADSFRCGGKLVRVGDTKIDVLQKCKEPQLKEVVSGDDEHKIEQWIYQRGGRKFPVIVTFRGVKVSNVEAQTD